MSRKLGIRALCLLFAAALFLGQCSIAARADNSWVTVYVTDTGEKYHRDACPYLKSSKAAIYLKDASQMGYEPCSKCSPPILGKSRETDGAPYVAATESPETWGSMEAAEAGAGTEMRSITSTLSILGFICIFFGVGTAVIMCAMEAWKKITARLGRREPRQRGTFEGNTKSEKEWNI